MTKLVGIPKLGPRRSNYKEAPEDAPADSDKMPAELGMLHPAQGDDQEPSRP